MDTDLDSSGKQPKAPSNLDVALPIVTLIVSIAGAVALYGVAAIDGPVQVALLLSCMVAATIILKNRHPWHEISASGGRAVSSIVSAIFILLAVGALIGTWNMSGTIPTLVDYGIRLLQPSWFYPAAALVCAAVSLGIGSSWTTAGTIGVGLIGIASLVGVSPAITAGAVISGAYFGDKTSPLSETTVLSAQLAGVDVHKHIRAQIWTSGPAFGLALVIFGLLGLTVQPAGDVTTGIELAKLDQLFWITPLNLIPLLCLVLLSIRKVPAALAIMASALIAGVTAVILQPDAIVRFVDDPSLALPIVYIKGIWTAMANGYQANSGISDIDSLLSRGGMDSMLYTLWLIIGAVTFGTLMEEFGMLAKLINPLLERAHNTALLFVSVLATAIGLNIVAGDQYIALVLPLRLYKVEFRKRGLAPQNLSRAAADGGTVTSALVPWNSCGAYMSATLGVPTMLYLPYCLFNIFSPLLSLVLGITGFKIKRISPEEEA
ncbi:MAG: Na+/H+ antiporter NhaC family protein [Thermoleophilia bacterium]